MAQFDGRKWLPVTSVPYQFNKLTHYTPRLHAVSVDYQETLVLSTYADGVLRYRNGVWKQELMEIPAGLSRICLAGEKTVMLIAAFRRRRGKELTRNDRLFFRAHRTARDESEKDHHEVREDAR
jgi:hypothetical protein